MKLEAMQHRKATAWGAGVMGVAGLGGALLGPSPLLLPFAPLVAIAWVPFSQSRPSPSARRWGLPSSGLTGKAAFVVWSAALGAGAGRLVGAWRTRWRARRTDGGRER